LIRSHRIDPVIGGLGAWANQPRVIYLSAYGSFSAGFILDGERASLLSYFFLKMIIYFSFYISKFDDARSVFLAKTSSRLF
jgi:hypothetical protein